MMMKADWFHLSVDGWTLSIHSYLSDKVVLARFACGEISILKPFDLEKKEFEYNFMSYGDGPLPKVSLEICKLFARLASE